MKKQTRRKFSADFKAKVAIEALKERSTIEQIAVKYEIHPTQISTWKKEFLENAALAFGGDDSQREERQNQEDKVEKLFAQIGQLKVENDFLKKKLL
jgi:transposase